MNKIVGIRFKPAGKIYDFDCGAFVLKTGDHVIVETEHGQGIGVVTEEARPCEEKQTDKPLKQVFRLATEEDFLQRDKNIELERMAFLFCQKCIKELNIVMSLFSVESTFDGSKLTFFFTAEGRVDFRQLVKSLVKEFRLRIEMRQVGIRNQAKMLSGIGRCGREICCATFLEKFDPVSIRMAKDQNLSLNPTKISGLCGRLMCCLTYENDTYNALRETFPKIGTTVRFSGGVGKIVRQNVIGGRVAIQLEDNTEIEIKLSEIINEENKEPEIKPGIKPGIQTEI